MQQFSGWDLKLTIEPQQMRLLSICCVAVSRLCSNLDGSTGTAFTSRWNSCQLLWPAILLTEHIRAVLRQRALESSQNAHLHSCVVQRAVDESSGGALQPKQSLQPLCVAPPSQAPHRRYGGHQVAITTCAQRTGPSVAPAASCQALSIWPYATLYTAPLALEALP